MLKRVAAFVLLLATTVHAHHSFSMFDITNRMTLVGTVTTFEWTNPHVIIGIEVPDQNGTPQTWTIELGSPSILQRVGWKFNDLKPGDKVTIVANPLKNGQRGGLLVSATLADGRVLASGGGQSTPPPVPATAR